MGMRVSFISGLPERPTLMSDFKVVSVLNPTVVITGITGVIFSAGANSASTGTVVFGSSAGNVTFGMNPAGYVTASAPSGGGGGGAALQGSGTYTQNTGTIQFQNSNGVTFGLSNNGVMTASVAPTGGAQTGISSFAVNGSTITQGQVVFTNSNNVSFGLNGSTVTASASYPAQTVQPMYFSASGSSTSSGTIQFANSNGVSFSLSNGSVVGTVATNYQSQGAYLTTAMQSQSSSAFIQTSQSSLFEQTSQMTLYQTTGNYLTTARQSNDAIGLNTALTANGLSVTANSSGLSINMPAFDYASNTTNYAGLGTTFAGTNVSGSITINSNGLNLALSAPTPGGGGAINVSAGTTSNHLQTIVFSNSNGVSFGLNGSTITASAVGGGGGDGYNIIGVNAVATSLSTTMTLTNANNVSFGLNAGLITASASFPAQTAYVFSNSNGVSFGTNGSTVTATVATNYQSQGAYLTTARASNDAIGLNTALTANGVSVTANSSGLSLNFPAFLTTAMQSGSQSQLWIMTNSSQAITGTNISGTMYSNGLSMSVAAPGGGGAINVTINGSSNNVQTMQFANSNNVTFGLNGSTITASVNAGGGGYTNTWFQPEIYGNTMTTAHANGTLYMRPFELQGYMDIDKYIVQQMFSSQLSSTLSMSASVSAGSASSGSGSWGQTGTVILFSRVNTNETNASYNSIVSFGSDSYSMSAGYSASVSWSTNASSATASFTTSWQLGFVSQIDGSGGVTYGNTGTSGSTTFSSTSTNANSFSSSYVMSAPYQVMSGMRPIFIPAGIDAVPGEYWFGMIQSTQTGSTNMSLQRPLLLASSGILYFTASSNNSYLEYGNTANISSSNWRLGFGSYSASSNTTGQIPLSAFTSMSSNASMYVALDGHTK